MLMLGTGFRIQEALSLKVADVLEQRVMVARQNMKGAKQSRSVVLSDRARDAVNSLIVADSLVPADYLFRSAKGGPISRVQAWRIFKGAVRSLGLSERIALHSTRKTFAEKAYKHFDKDLVKTSKALGHKSILSTASYLSFKTEEIDDFIKGL